jgi:quercetin dioxygenase-like cupin family protein
MLKSHFEIVYNQIVNDINIEVLHQDDSMVMAQLSIRNGAILPEHVHPTDHSAYLLRGKIRIVADGIVSEFVKGDSWTMYKNVCHYTEALEDAVVLEVFNLEGETEDFPIEQSAGSFHR